MKYKRKKEQQQQQDEGKNNQLHEPGDAVSVHISLAHTEGNHTNTTTLKSIVHRCICLAFPSGVVSCSSFDSFLSFLCGGVCVAVCMCASACHASNMEKSSYSCLMERRSNENRLVFFL